MPKFIVDLWLDGYETEEESNAAAKEFIDDQLNFSGSSVQIQEVTPCSNCERLKEYIQEIQLNEYGRAENESHEIVQTQYKEIQRLQKKLEMCKVAILKGLDFAEQVKTQNKIIPGEVDDFEESAKSAMAKLEKE